MGSHLHHHVRRGDLRCVAMSVVDHAGPSSWGRIMEGAVADLLVLSQDLELQSVVLRGCLREPSSS